jgi:DNA-binding response OmpR family regulator
MRVLIADTDQQLARERAWQLQMDGHQPSLALTARAAALKLAEKPDALVLCNLPSPVQSIALLRALRSGEILVVAPGNPCTYALRTTLPV